VETAPGVDTKIFLVGNDVFGSSNRGTPTFPLEATKATLGSGSSSITGDAWLTVTHNGTNYQLSLNGGTAVDVPLTGDKSNVAVTDANGKVLYVDASSAELTTGTDLVRVPGTYNIFDTLISARDLLYNTHSLPDAQLTTAMQGMVSAVSEVSEHILQTEVSVGLTTGFLYDLQNSLENSQANNEQESDTLSQVDIAQVAIDLSRRQTLYQMSLSVAGKLMQISLLDFIQ
jgi:flagellin-like hook-associated protein FlgL